MSNQRCKHVRPDGFNCGSYAFNLYKEGIDQGDLCDVHYWQNKAQRQPLTRQQRKKVLASAAKAMDADPLLTREHALIQQTEAAHGITGDKE